MSESTTIAPGDLLRAHLRDWLEGTRARARQLEDLARNLTEPAAGSALRVADILERTAALVESATGTAMKGAPR